MLEYRQGPCPLGKKCEEAIDGAIYVCPWFTKMRGQHPQTGEEIDESKCAVAWLPVLMCENSRQQKSTSAAVESFRNEMVKSNTSTLQLLLGATKHDS